MAACVLTLEWLDGAALRVGVGVTAQFYYAALMCAHLFELSSPSVLKPGWARPGGETVR